MHILKVEAEYSFGETILENGQFQFSDLKSFHEGGFAIILNHAVETFVHLNGKIVPVAVIGTGQTLPLIEDQYLSLLPLSLLNVTAGARSIFLLPKVSDTTNFWRLARAYTIHSK